ncbi:trigger factor-like protein TIG, Chloroplastic [Glycine soja]|uniref:trigger factor-like protein TIG, Chloroplastic n=1 Tax=Glycine soja TaxID=3848 RepID=UPI00103C43E0|nr:trigger factor-like protein TIG, Chloroplastic [Glycine soja]
MGLANHFPTSLPLGFEEKCPWREKDALHVGPWNRDFNPFSFSLTFENPNRAIEGGALESTRYATIDNEERLSDYIKLICELYNNPTSVGIEKMFMYYVKEKILQIPGFRPGKKVPESILISYVGSQNVQKATIESILRRTLSHAMTSVTGRALQESVRIVTKFSEMEETYSSLGSLGYDVLVDIAPEIKWIPDNNAYKNLKIVVEMDSDIDAHTASEQEFRRRYKSIGALKVVTDRAKGD